MTTTEGKSFGTVLRSYRKRAGLTQEELAERAEISPRGLMYLERDERCPRPATAHRLAIALALNDEERSDFLCPLPATRPTNFPDEPTPFIGRVREIEQISALMREPRIRHVTLTGPGGSGKTRLALQVTNSLPDFQDGVFFINLAPLTDPALVPQTVAEALNVNEIAGQHVTQTLSDALLGQRLLLVLDNYEHLLDAASMVSVLLDRCPTLHVLVTSRIPLHLAREHEYPVPPLPVPDLLRLPAPAGLGRIDAVALFVQRAKALRPDFALTEASAPAVAEICVRLDGLPLAIELAAARLKLFSPESLLQHLEDRLSLLTGGARDVPARQQTLRATIDWSYSLLTEEERTLFAHLSVFAGGCTLAAAQAVCTVDGELDVLDGITSLVDKSLLRQAGGVEVRTSMLETIGEYAAERLDESGKADDIRAGHAAYFYRMIENVEVELVGPNQVAWMRRIDRELDNIRAALAWYLNSGQAGAELRLAGTLWRYWDSRALFEEGRRWLSAGLAVADNLDPADRVHQRLGMLVWRQGKLQEAKRLLECGLEESQAEGDDSTVAAIWSTLGCVVAEFGDLVEAERLHKQGLALRRSLGDGHFIAHSLCNLGILLTDVKRFDEAIVCLEEGLALAREAHDAWSVGEILGHLGAAILELGDDERAVTLFVESLHVLRDLGEHGPATEALRGLMATAGIRGQGIRAARLGGAVERLGMMYGWSRGREGNNPHLTAVRSSLDPATWRREWEGGTAMTHEEAVAYALNEVELPT